MCNYVKCASSGSKATGKCKNCKEDICPECHDPKNPNYHLHFSENGNCYFTRKIRPYGKRQSK